MLIPCFITNTCITITCMLLILCSARTNVSGDGIDLHVTNFNVQSGDPILDQVMENSLRDNTEHVESSAKQMRLFSNSIMKKGWQIRGETPEDGNCAFWAISDQLELTDGSCYTHTHLRQNVVQFMKDLQQVC